MSKKMLKRSLALGALMAFVITGSAMAANITTQTEADTINGQNIADIEGYIFAENSNIKIEAGEVNIINNSLKGTDTDGNEEFITVCADAIESKQAYVGIMADKLYITSANDYGVCSFGYGEGASASIDLGSAEKPIEEIKIITPKNYGMYLWGRGGAQNSIDVFAKSLTIESGLGALRGYHCDSGSTMNLGSATNPIDKIVLKGGAYDQKAFAIYAHTTTGINIYGNDVEISGSEGSMKATYGNIDVKGYKKLAIAGDMVIFNSGREDRGVTINKGINDALVEINANISIDSTDKVSFADITLGKSGSYLKGSITDNSGKSTLNMNPGTVWEVTGESKINKVAGNQGILKVDETVDGLVTVTNGEDAKNFTLMGSRKASASLDGDNLAGELDELAETVDGIAFANYKFEEGTALGAIEAYQENGEWKITERTNVTNSNISDVAALGLMAWRSEMNDMNKRLGELRNANGEHGVWVRMVRGETEYEAVKNQYNTYQLGYDEKLSVDKSWTVGMALSYTDGENSFNGGNGENKHKGLAIYGSKLNNDGSFIDLIAKYARLDHDVEVGTEKGDYEANGYSVSAEYGKRFQQGNGLWVEPQVELTYGKVGSADYMIGKNRAVTHEGMESLVGRVGFSLGKDIKQGNVYARASYLYDFEGETEASYTDAVGNRRYINDDLGGGWWEVGVGANINLSRATYIYADVEKTFGGEVDTNWQWNLGVRYSF